MHASGALLVDWQDAQALDFSGFAREPDRSEALFGDEDGEHDGIGPLLGNRDDDDDSDAGYERPGLWCLVPLSLSLSLLLFSPN